MNEFINPTIIAAIVTMVVAWSVGSFLGFLFRISLKVFIWILGVGIFLLMIPVFFGMNSHDQMMTMATSATNQSIEAGVGIFGSFLNLFIENPLEAVCFGYGFAHSIGKQKKREQ